jgi:MoaA/NifB/PqqE/SkfB family radical SAM enzyme
MTIEPTTAPAPARPEPAAGPAPATAPAPRVRLSALDTLWFQVGGTVCNLACGHCFISCSPTNHTHEMMTLAEVEPYLTDAVRLGVKEYYFTGGEPFLNPEIEAILAAALRVGPATVLTNGLLLDPARCRRLAALAAAAEHSLDLRVSLDGWDAASNDPIRGEGTFERALAGLRNLVAAGINPVLTVTDVGGENSTDGGKERFFELLRGLGIDKPRLKVLPLFRLGAEAERTGAYESWQRLSAEDAAAAGADAGAQGWDHLQCSACRMVTGRGVWVCPILVNEPAGKMGERLADALGDYPLEHPACWTCHVYGVSCRT